MLPQTPKNFRKKFLQKIEEAWDKNPELRFNQLIVDISKPKEPCPEIFYMTNDTMLNKIKEWLNKTKE